LIRSLTRSPVATGFPLRSNKLAAELALAVQFSGYDILECYLMQLEVLTRKSNEELRQGRSGSVNKIGCEYAS
jgi:hypothetical protein